MRFVETPIFTKAIDRLLDVERYRELQSALLVRPEPGPTIAGSGGAGKMRWAGSADRAAGIADS